ncbi:MFS transporter [bacterium]|nr:MAG: MFS transporter [bacterium]
MLQKINNNEVAVELGPCDLVAPQANLNLPLLALSVGAFAIGVTEFSPMGLLPLIASDLKVSIPVAGQLVTGYALGVMIGAPIMTLSTGRVDRKTLLISLMAIFVVGSLMAALSTGYNMLMLARLVTSLCHGAFFGVGSIVAADLVPPTKRAGAVATMFMGLTIANVGGVPLAAWVGQTAGWQTAFWGITALGLFAMAALALSMPKVPIHGSINMRDELRVLGRPVVLVALLMTVLSSGAMFTVLTYIALILRDSTHASPTFITWMLVLYGLGLSVGNWVGGLGADKSVDRTLIVGLTCLTVLLLVFAVVMQWHIPAAILIFAWGVATFALVPPLQVRVMTHASDAPNVASAINIGAFNLGNALGAALGGAVITLKLGYPAISIAGAGLAGLALVLALLTKKKTAKA